jgi:hypothetical protein
MSAMLMVMSGMDPHTIRWTLGWVWLGCLDGWLVYPFGLNYHSGLCGRFDVTFRGEELLEV